MILYFTGTGNSEFVAKRLASQLNDDCENLFEKIRSNKVYEFNSDKTWVLVTPTYAWQIPYIVRDFLKKSKLTGSKDIYFVLTCGDDIGNAEKYERELAKELGLNFKGIKAIVMPENYIAMFDAPSEKEARAITEKALPVIDSLAEKIAKGEVVSEKVTFMGRINSSVVNSSFYSLFVKDKKFRAGEGCNGCGLCEKLCPLCNIEIKNGRPSWNGNCTHCMACICHCPKEAIEYGKKSVGQVRYKFREV